MSRLFRRRPSVRERLRQLADAYNAVVDYAVSVEHERDAQRDIIADLGRRLDAAQQGPLGDTAPLPRTRSLTPVEPFPPKWWTT